jgi:hypothetical protein
MNVISPVETGAFLYYDGTGIRGVSFVADPSLADCDQFCIPGDVAAQFIDGSLDHRDWLVWRNAAGVALYKNSEDVAISVDLIEPRYTLVPAGATGAITLAVILYREARRLVLQINSNIGLQYEGDASLRFMITAKHDPSAVLHLFTVPLAELARDRLFDVDLPIEPSIPIAVHTWRLFPTYVREATDVDLLLPLPRGHFVDLLRFESGSITRGLQAVVHRADRLLRLALVGQAIERYERPDALRLLLSRPGDPSLVQYTVQVQSLPVEVELPNLLVKREFDIWSQLLYRRCAVEFV